MSFSLFRWQGRSAGDQRVIKKFAWLPVRMPDDTVVWGGFYHEEFHWVRDYGGPAGHWEDFCPPRRSLAKWK